MDLVWRWARAILETLVFQLRSFALGRLAAVAPWLEAELVPEKEAAKLNPGQEAELSVAFLPLNFPTVG